MYVVRETTLNPFQFIYCYYYFGMGKLCETTEKIETHTRKYHTYDRHALKHIYTYTLTIDEKQNERFLEGKKVKPSKKTHGIVLLTVYLLLKRKMLCA